jgi:hypothetical protein
MITALGIPAEELITTFSFLSGLFGIRTRPEHSGIHAIAFDAVAWHLPGSGRSQEVKTPPRRAALTEEIL